MTSDEDDDIRNNSILGIGELALFGGEIKYPHYSNVLQALSNLLAKEQRGRVVSSIRSWARFVALSWQTKTWFQSKKYSQNLPLKEDNKGYLIVFECLLHLYRFGDPIVKENLSQTLMVAIGICGNKKYDKPETHAAVTNLLCTIYREMTEYFMTVVADCQLKLQSRFQQF